MTGSPNQNDSVHRDGRSRKTKGQLFTFQESATKRSFKRLITRRDRFRFILSPSAINGLMASAQTATGGGCFLLVPPAAMWINADDLTGPIAIRGRRGAGRRQRMGPRGPSAEEHIAFHWGGGA